MRQLGSNALVPMSLVKLAILTLQPKLLHVLREARARARTVSRNPRPDGGGRIVRRMAMGLMMPCTAPLGGERSARTKFLESLPGRPRYLEDATKLCLAERQERLQVRRCRVQVGVPGRSGRRDGRCAPGGPKWRLCAARSCNFCRERVRARRGAHRAADEPPERYVRRPVAAGRPGQQILWSLASNAGLRLEQERGASGCAQG